MSAAVPGLEMVEAVAESIRELGEVPSGHLYALCMGHMSLERYDAVISSLVRAGVVRRSAAHLLTWTGPVLPAEQQHAADDEREGGDEPDGGSN